MTSLLRDLKLYLPALPRSVQLTCFSGLPVIHAWGKKKKICNIVSINKCNVKGQMPETSSPVCTLLTPPPGGEKWIKTCELFNLCLQTFLPLISVRREDGALFLCIFFFLLHLLIDAPPPPLCGRSLCLS